MYLMMDQDKEQLMEQSMPFAMQTTDYTAVDAVAVVAVAVVAAGVLVAVLVVG
jgi:hypothetical protein